MLSGVVLWPLQSPVYCEFFSLSALSLVVGQDLLLIPLAGAVSGISKLQYFCSTELSCCCCILFSQSVFAHTTSAISYYPISDCYLPAHSTAVAFCSFNQFLHTPHLPYLTVLYLTATFQPTLFNKIR